MQIFQSPSNDTIKVNIPPMPLRYNNKEKCFAFQADGWILNSEGSPIYPDASIIGVEHFWGYLRDSVNTENGEQIKTPKLEAISFMYWVPLPTAKNTHDFLPIGTLVATPLVTKAQQNFIAHSTKVENFGKALWSVVTNFKPGKYDTATYKNVPTLDFVVNDVVAKDAKVAAFLKEITAWIGKSETAELLHQVSSQSWAGSLIKLSGNPAQDNAAKEMLRYQITGVSSSTFEALRSADTGEDVLTLPSTSTLVMVS